MRPGTLQAVLFDYYFTLATPAATDFYALALAAGADVDQEQVAARRRELLAARSEPPPLPFDGDPAPFRRYWEEWERFGEEIIVAFGAGPSRGRLYAEARHRAHATAALAPGASQLLAHLRQQGMPVGLVSDADRDYLQDSLAHLGLGFDVVVCSEELGCYKPHRKLFLTACDRLGIQPDHGVFVRDGPLVDIEGARRAGLRTVWINSRRIAWPPELRQPDAAVEDLSELGEVLDRLGAR